MKRSFSISVIFLVAIMSSFSVWAINLDDIVVGTTNDFAFPIYDNGSLISIDGQNLGLIAEVRGMGGDVVGVNFQSDGDVFFAPNAVGGTNAHFGIRNPDDMSVVVPQNGLGAELSTASVFSNGDVFMGTGTNASGHSVHNQIRRFPEDPSHPNYPGGVIVGGPAGVGARMIDSVVQSDDDLIILYDCPVGSLTCGQPRSRVRRNPPPGLFLNNIGVDQTLANLGVAVDLLSDDSVVIGREDRIVQIYRGDTLSPDLGGFEVTSGQLGNANSTIVDVVSLSNDDVAVALYDSVGNQSFIQVFDLDIPGQQMNSIALGTFSGLEITKMDSQSDDQLVAGTTTGLVKLYDFGGGNVTEALSADLAVLLNGTAGTAGPITSLAVNPFGDPPVVSCDFDASGMCDIDDINLMYQQGNLVTGVAVNTGNSKFDLNGNNSIDNADLSTWLTDAATENGYGSAYRRGDTDDVSNKSPAIRDVDITDFNALSANFAPSGTPGAVFVGNWHLGNFDGDGDIDITDFNALSANFAPSSYGAQSIPEPTSIGLILVGVVLLAQLRRGR